MKIVINEERACVVLGKLLETLRRGAYPYNVAMVPQASIQFPESFKQGSRVHSLYFFYTCLYMRGSIKSEFAMQALANMYAVFPEVFFPEEVQHRHPGSIRFVLESSGLA